MLTGLVGDPDATFGDLANKARLGGMHPVIAGTPEQIADYMELTIDETGVDGFNIFPNVQPGGFEDLVDLVIPELQRRGRYRTSYEATTLRERFTGDAALATTIRRSARFDGRRSAAFLLSALRLQHPASTLES